MNVSLADKSSVLKAQSDTLRLLTVAKKKLAGRKPKKEKADRELASKREAAVRKVEEEHKKRNLKLLAEMAELEKQITILSKRYMEFAGDLVRVPETAFPITAVAKVES